MIGDLTQPAHHWPAQLRETLRKRQPRQPRMRQGLDADIWTDIDKAVKAEVGQITVARRFERSVQETFDHESEELTRE